MKQISRVLGCIGALRQQTPICLATYICYTVKGEGGGGLGLIQIDTLDILKVGVMELQAQGLFTDNTSIIDKYTL